MDGDRKKRKLDKEPAAEEEESEEEKMEKFFALIRSTREARDRLRGSGLPSQEESEKSREDRRKAEEDLLRSKESAWNPTFRPEDFSQDPILYTPSTAAPSAPDVPGSSSHEAQAGPSKSKQQDEGKDDDDKKKKEKDDGDDDRDDLNLNLSL